MPMITPEAAQLLADELIKAGRARATDRDALIRELIARSRVTGDASPETAIGNALMVAPPRTVTPATPAPMQPGVQLVAPKPTVEMVPQAQPEAAPVGAPPRAAPRPSRYRPMLDSTLAQINSLEGAIRQSARPGQPVDIVQQAQLRALKSRAQQLQDRVQAEESADIPEEMRTALEGQQARLARREELLAEAKARSPWEALLAGGAAMAQGRRGERFTEALARGLQTGIQEYNRARRANEEGVESIAEARDQAVINRYNMLQKARDEAVALADSGQELDERTLRMSKLTNEDIMNTALLRPTIAKGEAEATVAKAKADVAPRRERAEIREILGRGSYYESGGSRGGGGGGAGTKGYSTLLSSLDREANDLNRTIRDITVPSAKKMEAAQRLAEVNAERQRIRAAISRGQLGGGTATGAGTSGAGTPNFVYSPGKGLQPVK